MLRLLERPDIRLEITLEQVRREVEAEIESFARGIADANADDFHIDSMKLTNAARLNPLCQQDERDRAAEGATEADRVPMMKMNWYVMFTRMSVNSWTYSTPFSW